MGTSVFGTLITQSNRSNRAVTRAVTSFNIAKNEASNRVTGLLVTVTTPPLYRGVLLVTSFKNAVTSLITLKLNSFSNRLLLSFGGYIQ